jgi:hypothetical protein
MGAPYAAGIGAPTVRRIGTADSRTTSRKHSPFGNERVMVGRTIDSRVCHAVGLVITVTESRSSGERYEGTEYTGYDIRFWKHSQVKWDLRGQNVSHLRDGS